MLKHPPLPEFTRADGNPFAWIIATAKRIRAERTQVQLLDRAIRKAESQRGYRPLEPHEARQG